MTRSATTHRNFTLAAVVLALGMTTVVAAQGAPEAATPVPTAVVVPVTADSYPYMTASRLMEPMDLSAYGYVEEEYLVSGRASVYNWAANRDLTVRTPNVPYTTRILVRRPNDATRFSGNVAVAKAVSDRWLTPSTAIKVLEDMLSVIPVPATAGAGSSETSTR